MTTSSRRLASLLVMTTLMVAGPAWAQNSEPTAADLETARELYREGKELRQKGDLRGALERFKAAHDTGQTPVTGLELGKMHMQLGELVEAREVLLSVGRLKVASDETEKSAAARTEAAELAEQIRTRIPTLVVKVSGAKSEASRVTVDGTNVPVISSSSMRKVNPGEHAIIVRGGGREEKRSVTVAESETKEVEVALTDASPKTAEEPSTSKEEGSDGGGKSVHVLTWIGLGIGVGGIAVGSVAGALALGKAGKVKDACQGLSCPPSAKTDVDRGRTMATISTIGFAVGGAGLVTAVVGYFFLSSRQTDQKTAQTEPRVRVALTPNWAGLHGSF